MTNEGKAEGRNQMITTGIAMTASGKMILTGGMLYELARTMTPAQLRRVWTGQELHYMAGQISSNYTIGFRGELDADEVAVVKKLLDAANA
jgi:hypothetical protein